MTILMALYSHFQNCRESWIVRETSSNIEEELYIRDRTVIWSRGNFGVSLADLDNHGSAGRCLVRAYTCEYKVEQVLWCSFAYDCGNEYRGNVDDGEESEDDSPLERPRKANRDRRFRRGRDRHRRDRDTESTACSEEKEAVCILHEKQLSIYTTNSEEYFTKLHFKVSHLS